MRLGTMKFGVMIAAIAWLAGLAACQQQDETTQAADVPVETEQSLSGAPPTENTTGEPLEEMAEGAAEVVETVSGLVQGESRNGVIRFLGIPYAQSIAGRNRFAPPQPLEPWTDVRQAVRFADSSPQQAAGPTGSTPVTPAFEAPAYVEPGDDCLALNVWTPAGADGSLPVMVWLHGGGWTSGSASSAIYDGQNLASRGDVIVVTINHRLGASGLTDFSRVLGGDFADSANLGIRDIIAALEWVRDNIAAFGGNPDLVTIFGESGGGWKVSTMLGVPSAQGLFHRAIIESGPLTRFLTPQQADELANAVLSELEVTPETADKLYEISFAEVTAAEVRVLANSSMSSMMQAPGFPSGFWPVIDGDIIPDHVFDGDAAPSSLDVPLLIGQNGTEFTLFMLGDQDAYALDDAGLEQRLAGVFGQDAAPQILQTYRRDFPDYDPSGLWFRIFSDYAMGALSSEIMDVRSVPGAAPVYAFRFDWQTPILDGRLYSPHTIEIPFVFDNAITEAGVVMTGGGPEVAELAKTVSGAWVEFARTGTPAADGLPQWPAVSEEGRESMHLNTTSRVAPYMDPAMVELFHNMLWAQAGLASAAATNPPPTTTPLTTAVETDTSQDDSNDMEDNRMNIAIGDNVLTATLAENSSAAALKELLAEGPLTVNMRDYERMEKVGPLGMDLPRNDEPLTTEAGDIILFQGNALVIYYAPNSWNFTRLGKIDDVTADQLREILGDGDVTITLSLTQE